MTMSKKEIVEFYLDQYTILETVPIFNQSDENDLNAIKLLECLDDYHLPYLPTGFIWVKPNKNSLEVHRHVSTSEITFKIFVFKKVEKKGPIHIQYIVTVNNNPVQGYTTTKKDNKYYGDRLYAYNLNKYKLDSERTVRGHIIDHLDTIDLGETRKKQNSTYCPFNYKPEIYGKWAINKRKNIVEKWRANSTSYSEFIFYEFHEHLSKTGLTVQNGNPFPSGVFLCPITNKNVLPSSGFYVERDSKYHIKNEKPKPREMILHPIVVHSYQEYTNIISSLSRSNSIGKLTNDIVEDDMNMLQLRFSAESETNTITAKIKYMNALILKYYIDMKNDEVMDLVKYWLMRCFSTLNKLNKSTKNELFKKLDSFKQYFSELLNSFDEKQLQINNTQEDKTMIRTIPFNVTKQAVYAYKSYFNFLAKNNLQLIANGLETYQAADAIEDLIKQMEKRGISFEIKNDEPEKLPNAIQKRIGRFTSGGSNIIEDQNIKEEKRKSDNNIKKEVKKEIEKERKKEKRREADPKVKQEINNEKTFEFFRTKKVANSGFEARLKNLQPNDVIVLKNLLSDTKAKQFIKLIPENKKNMIKTYVKTSNSYLREEITTVLKSYPYYEENCV